MNRAAVDLEIAKQSLTIKTMLEELGLLEEETVPLGSVRGELLQQIIEWMIHHQYDSPFPDEDKQNKMNGTDDTKVPSWDKKFLKKANNVYELLPTTWKSGSRALYCQTRLHLLNH